MPTTPSRPLRSSPDMGTELEIKLSLAGKQDFLAACRLGRDAGRILQDNRFFDLPDKTLQRIRWALRLRRQWNDRTEPSGPADSTLLTVKGPSKRRGGAVERPEYEWPLDEEQSANLLTGRITPAQTADLAGCAPFWTSEPALKGALSQPLTKMIQTAWFRNLRVRRILEMAGRPVVLEIDQTSFPSGLVRYEVEMEIHMPENRRAPRDIETMRRALIETLSREGVVVTGSGRGKYSTALGEMKKIMQRNVPDRGCLLRFDVLSKARVWGGRKLAERYGKPQAPEGQPCGETWEIVDLPEDQSRVQAGPLQGAALGVIRDEHLDWLMGRSSLLDGRFPLLLKLIDAQETLSVQVHPDEAAAARLQARPKTECWVILDADPGACLYLGLRPGVTKDQLRQACRGDSLEPLLNRVEVAPMDVIFIPSGTVHAIGAGLVLAELQQSSDTTYRLHDWGRMGLDGKPRQLHIDQALESIHFDAADPPPWRPRRGPGRVISSEAFCLDLLHWNQVPADSRVLDHDVPLVLLPLTGALRVRTGIDDQVLDAGASALAPAASRQTELSPAAPDTWVLVGRPT